MVRTWWSARNVRRTSNTRVCARVGNRLRLETLEDRLLLATRTWSGAGPDNNWNTAANWAENTVPVANDDLVFPGGAARLTNVNNLTADTVFNSLRFDGGGYAITGNALGLGAGGLTQTVAGAVTNTLGLNLTLAAARTFTITGTSTLIVSGPVNGAGGFTKEGDGTLRLAGTAANTYTGATIVNAGVLDLNKSAGVVAVPAALTIGNGAGASRDIVRLAASDQIAASVVPQINISGTLDLATFVQTVAGLSLTGGQVVGTTSVLTMTGNVTTSAAADAALISGNLTLGAGTRTFTVADGAATDDLVLAALVGGAGELTKAGPGRLVLGEANTYTGITTVQAGTLTLRKAAALGATSAGTTVASQAVLELQGGITVGLEALTFSGAAGAPAGILRNVTENNTWTGSITLSGDAAVFDVADGQLTLSGVLSGISTSQSVTKRGTGTLIYAGTEANTFAGTTTVAEGVLQLNKTAGINAVAGNLVIGDGTGAARADVVRWLAANQIADSAAVAVTTSGLLDLNGFTETSGPLTMTGGTVSTGAGTLTLNGNVTTNAAAAAATIAGNLALGGATRTFTIADGAVAEDLVLSAVVSGAAGVGLSKEGPGTLLLGSDNTYTGTTAVNAGTLVVSKTQAAGVVTVAAGATLTGNGTVGATTVSGTLTPGFGGTDVLRTGDLALNSGATFRVELNGTVVGTGYDQLVVTGTVNLGGATLTPTLGFTSPSGTQYVVLSNDGTDAVTGTFNGLAEGATLTVNNRPFRLSYRGGDGNDIVLTDASVPTTVTLTASAVTSVFGQSVTFTAVVAPTGGGTGTPTGTVTFREGTATLGTATLTNGRATFTTTTLAVGSRQVTAVYEGDGTFNPSTSESLAQTVNKANTSIVVTAAPNPANPGQAVTITATLTVVAPGGGVPTGTVTFRDGATVLGTATIGANGVATLTTAALAAGAHTLTVVYAGETNFEGSTSAGFTLQVSTPLPTNQRFIAQLYQDLLLRSADPGGLTFWSGLLERGTSRTDVTLAITASQEYRTVVVRGLYLTFLRRDPDTGGLNAFVSSLNTGGTVEQVAAVILGSPEYFTIQGGGTNTRWLEAAYRDVFNRAVDPVGAAAHSAGLTAGMTRQQVADVLFSSVEGCQAQVRDLYQDLLRREPDAGGLAAHVAALQHGSRREQVIAVIAGSPEYFARV